MLPSALEKLPELRAERRHKLSMLRSVLLNVGAKSRASRQPSEASQFILDLLILVGFLPRLMQSMELLPSPDVLMTSSIHSAGLALAGHPLAPFLSK